MSVTVTAISDGVPATSDDCVPAISGDYVPAVYVGGFHYCVADPDIPPDHSLSCSLVVDDSPTGSLTVDYLANRDSVIVHLMRLPFVVDSTLHSPADCHSAVSR